MMRTLMTGALALSMLIVPSPDAEACLHGMKNMDRDMQLLSRAEKALRNGQNKRAFTLARRVYSGSKAVKRTGKNPRARRFNMRAKFRLDRRASRIMAVATVRLNGKTGLAHRAAGTEKQRTTNLEWAVTQLRTQSERRPHDSLLKTRLGEALAKIPSHEKEALKVLESLAKEDFLADAHGYAAFAKVLSASGDKDGVKEALKRCRAMASKKSICKL